MTNSYLIEVVRAMLPTEREEFASLLGMPQYNRANNAKELERLYHTILQAAPGFGAEDLAKNTVYFKVFTEKKMIQGKLEKLMADLNKLLRTFALNKRYFAESNDMQQQLDWAAWLRERGLMDRAQQAITKLKAQGSQEKTVSLAQFRTDLLLMEEVHEWESLQNQFKGDLSIPRIIESLELYFYTYRTALANRYLLQQKTAQLPHIELLKEEDFYLEQNVLLQISKDIYAVFQKDTPTIGDFQRLMKILKDHEDGLSEPTIIQFYVFLRSACNLLINAGSLEFINILHEIHIDNLERGLFFLNDEIHPNSYLNLVQIATRARDYAWAKNFTETYKDRIFGGDEEAFCYRLNMAQCLFAEGCFEEALTFLPEAPSSSHYHHIVRRLELKLYYEMDSELLPYKMDAFRKFIERTAAKSIAADQKTLHLNFVNMLLQLSQSTPKDKGRSQKLIARIQSKKLVAERAWLLEKARALA